MNKIKAPKLLNQNYKKNLIEIEDLGDVSIYYKLKNKKINRLKYYKKIILLLSKIQKIKTKNELQCLGLNLSGLTVMPVHGGEAAIHVGVSRHAPALQVPSQEGRCRCSVDGVELTPMRGT